MSTQHTALPCSACVGHPPGSVISNHPSCEAAILRAVNRNLLLALREMMPYLERQIKFLKYQRLGREFWPNREEAEGCLGRAHAAIERAKSPG